MSLNGEQIAQRQWSLGTHTRDVTMEEMEEAQKEFMKQMPKSA